MSLFRSESSCCLYLLTFLFYTKCVNVESAEFEIKGNKWSLCYHTHTVQDVCLNNGWYCLSCGDAWSLYNSIVLCLRTRSCFTALRIYLQETVHLLKKSYMRVGLKLKDHDMSWPKWAIYIILCQAPCLVHNWCRIYCIWKLDLTCVKTCD